MKHLWLGVFSVACLSACGAADDSAEIQKAAEDAEWAVQDAAAAQEEAAHLAWAQSDERPVNLACNAPGYDRGQSETFIGLHSPLYPSIEAKNKSLIAELKTLAPKATDEDSYDVEAYNDVIYDMMMLSQWAFMMGSDAQMRMQTNFCNHEQYVDNGCTLMARMISGGFAIEEMENVGDVLRFTVSYPDQDLVSEVEIQNEDFDGVKIKAVENGVPALNGNWQRAADGTERVSVRLGDNETQSYTENPDCSGTARWERLADDGSIRKMSFTWSSVRGGDFTLSFKDCKENALGDVLCKEGGL